ncbi:hypothetical protein QAD02_021473 [Eretmocerus hayati]|uniref:Uncharacterized protein n=1 Tax=Eretmocerus hayati TaxID=131215 RepID=A0ACC2PV54_9HYME|nr:hypothetical protein QAD02_021473 [Eretmocerus hayati]
MLSSLSLEGDNNVIENDDSSTENVTGDESVDEQLYDAIDKELPISKIELHSNQGAVSEAERPSRIKKVASLEIICIDKIEDLEGVKVESTRKQTRGRPKQERKLAVGLPKGPSLQAYVDMTKATQRKYMKDVQHIDAKELPDFCAEEDANYQILMQYFEIGAVRYLERQIQLKIGFNRYTCGVCSNEVVSNTVRCDRCLIWYHYKCVDFKPLGKRAKNQVEESWFCDPCRSCSS